MMNKKKAIIAIIPLLLGVLIYIAVLGDEKIKIDDIATLFDLPITEADILDVEIEHPSNTSTSIVLTIRHNEFLEKPTIFDISRYEGTRLAEKLHQVIESQTMVLDSVTIQNYFVSYTNKFGTISSLEIFLIIGENNGQQQMVFYTIVPKRLKLVIS